MESTTATLIAAGVGLVGLLTGVCMPVSEWRAHPKRTNGEETAAVRSSRYSSRRSLKRMA